jgi:hypothetical protein
VFFAFVCVCCDSLSHTHSLSSSLVSLAPCCAVSCSLARLHCVFFACALSALLSLARARVFHSPPARPSCLLSFLLSLSLARHLSLCFFSLSCRSRSCSCPHRPLPRTWPASLLPRLPRFLPKSLPSLFARDRVRPRGPTAFIVQIRSLEYGVTIGAVHFRMRLSGVRAGRRSIARIESDNKLESKCKASVCRIARTNGGETNRDRLLEVGRKQRERSERDGGGGG